MKEKLELINRLIEKKKLEEHGPYKFLIQSIYYTIDIDYLINLFINTKNSDIKKTLEYHLSSRFKDDNLDLKNLFNILLKKIKNLPYKQHQRVRLLLGKFVTNLPKSYIQKYFDFFSSTGYSPDLTAAMNVSNFVWNFKFDNAFIRKFLEANDEKYLDVVLLNGKPESILDNLAEIWNTEILSNYLKNKIIRKLSKKYIYKFEFLKEKEADKYLYAISFSNKEISDDEAENLFRKLNDNQRSFGIWCLGKLGKWNLIKKYISDYLP